MDLSSASLLSVYNYFSTTLRSSTTAFVFLLTLKLLPVRRVVVDRRTLKRVAPKAPPRTRRLTDTVTRRR